MPSNNPKIKLIMSILKSSLIRLIFFIGLFTSFLIVSCGDKEELPSPELDQKNETIAKKWLVSSASNARLSNNESEFLWFEFTLEGFYIIMKKDGTTLTGTYAKQENTLSLDGLGTLIISAMTESSFSFTFTADGSSESINIFTNEADKQVQESSRTDLLSKTWSVKRQHGKLFGTEIDQSYPNASIAAYTAVFSVYGTYVLAITYTNGTKQVFNRLWRWKDSDEVKICYGDTSSECNGENETSVLDLTETSFKLHTVIPSKDSEMYDELVVFKK